MNFKENIRRAIGQRNTMPFVKPEPEEPRLAPSRLSQGRTGPATQNKNAVKAEVNNDAGVLLNRGLPAPSYISNASARVANVPAAASSKPEDVELRDVQMQPVVVESTFTHHQTAGDISYQPEKALKEGSAMVKALKANVQKLHLGRLRGEVWLRDIESLHNQGAPTTMIAVCGATGAGKSSILNAILDDNIVPTSGMRACTAVVTEIAYHAKKTIEADVSFLSEAEWRQELTVLLDDLVDEDGNLKRSTDLRSEAGIAWQKVHAVYPSVSQEQLVRLSVDQIIARDQTVARILGTTKHIVAINSKAFAKQISRYIDSKDQKRGDKSKKDKSKDKSKKEQGKGKSLIDQLRTQNKSKNASLGIGRHTGPSKDKADDSDGPAFWPLIRQVRVKCNADALSTGAILVDLPGVADANAARNHIAKDYMKKCDCIWILAPITRAVDDKTARDLMGDAFKMQLLNGNYDDNAITFIATKCDDISCSEVIPSLQLERDPELEKIEDAIDSCSDETSEWKEKKSEAEANAKAIDQLLKQLRAHLKEYKDHLEAVENGQSFTPRVTAAKSKSKKRKSGSDDDDDDEETNSDTSRGRKRKSKSTDKRSPKRRRSGKQDDDDFVADDDDDDDLIFSDSDSEAEHGSDNDSDGESSSDEEKDDSESEEDEEDEDEDESITEESLQAKIQEVQDNLKQARADLSEFRRLRKEATDNIAALKKKQVRAQREKNAFCSLKRSDYSREVLKEDFRVGLKDLDDAAAEQRDPDNFDPTLNIRNYDAINLPVFTCSSRDYVRLKGQVQGDGDPSCFSNVRDTGIPELQKWCHHLTVASRERTAKNFLTHLKTFANSVKVYLEGIGGVTEADREALKENWASSMGDEDDDESLDDFSGNPFDLPGLAMLANPFRDMSGLYSMRTKVPKVDRFGEPIGITPRLAKDFAEVIDDCVDDLKKSFQDGLEEKCRTGAVNAASAAVETSDSFAASMHWATYRATLRRHGSWRQDLNVELSNPFTRQIASTWAKVFEADLFAGFEKATNDAITKLLKEVENSAAPGLKDRVKGQAEMANEEARVTLQKTIGIVRETINDEQKEVSRCLAPHVQDQLTDGYDRAMLERGIGSVARQKALFHRYVSDIRNEMFDGAADVILGRLADAAEAVGRALGNALEDLAAKIEVSVAVLWEGVSDSDVEQARTRAEVITVVTHVVREVQLWQEAAQMRVALSNGWD